MNAGLEYLFWCAFFSLILICWALVEFVERKDKDLLPAPRMDCIARGGKDHWLVSASRGHGENTDV